MVLSFEIEDGSGRAAAGEVDRQWQWPQVTWLSVPARQRGLACLLSVPTSSPPPVTLLGPGYMEDIMYKNHSLIWLAQLFREEGALVEKLT